MLSLIHTFKKLAPDSVKRCFACACICMLSILTAASYTSSAAEEAPAHNSTALPRWKTLWTQSNAGDWDAFCKLLSHYWEPELDRLLTQIPDEKIDAQLRELMQAAQSGSADACHMLALYHYYMKMDHRNGLYYLEKGVELGNPDCIIMLADSMLFGDLSENEIARLRELYLKAAKAGRSDAYASLATMYMLLMEKGIDVSQSAELCEKYVKVAEDAGSALAWAVKGAMYAGGTGRPANNNEAKSCYKIGAQKGNKLAQCIYGRLCLGTPGSESEGILYLKKSAAQFNAEAIAALGCVYFEGLFNEPQDIEKGLLLIQYAAYNGNALAQLRLGQIFYNGEHVLPNKELAIEWIKKSADRGHPEAQRIISYLQSDK